MQPLVRAVTSVAAHCSRSTRTTPVSKPQPRGATRGERAIVIRLALTVPSTGFSQSATAATGMPRRGCRQSVWRSVRTRVLGSSHRMRRSLGKSAAT